jgi:hypothetical protein
MGELSILKLHYYNATTDDSHKRFLLGFGGNSLQIFHFKFGYEQIFCKCIVDSTENRIKATSTLTYDQNVAA